MQTEGERRAEGVVMALIQNGLCIQYFNDGHYEGLEWASIETRDGYYVCEVYRCSDEGRKRFRRRARMVARALGRGGVSASLLYPGAP